MKKFFRRIGLAVLLYWGFNFIIGLYRALSVIPVECTEISEYEQLSKDYRHTRFWNDYSQRLHSCMQFESSFSENETSYNYRTNLTYPRYDGPHYEEYWGLVYEKLLSEQSTVLSSIRDSLSSIMINEGLDAYESANLVVTFVQDIPYTLIKSDECTAEDRSECLGEQKFGILTPTEFMYELKGDCDTRAVFLFKLLADFGYDPIIVISKEYLHAMIAINLPTAGDYIEHEGVNYYFWETTAKGWQAGMLPPSYPTVSYWKVALSLETDT